MNVPNMAEPRGIALIMVMLVTSALSALALGLAIVVSTSQLAAGNFGDGIAMLYAADAGVELAARDLARQPDWDLVLSGIVQGSVVDGAPSGRRNIPGGGSVSLSDETNQLNCGRTSACTATQMSANSGERTWGANNPTWRLFLYGPVRRMGPMARPTPSYILVWLADDSREADGDPLADGTGPGREGRGVVRVRSEVFGPTGARRAIEAEFTRVCRRQQGRDICQPGIRVQSWREVRQLIP